MRSRLFITIGVIGLFLMYLMQKEIQSFFYGIVESRYIGFSLARIVRFLCNDGFMISIIYGLFKEKKFVIIALYVQLGGILFILLPYLTIKYFTDYNGPLISFMHRLIVNPLLLLLLIPAFYYQKQQSNK